jgi:hypothetical protein
MALLRTKVGTPHEAHIYNGQTYRSLSAATADSAVRTVNVEEMTGNLHNNGSLLTCLEFGNAMADVLDSQTNLIVVITDCDGLIVDIRN